MDPKVLLVILVIVVMGWFAFGILFNLRRGDAFAKWLQRGLPRLGERTTFRWLGTSVVEMVIAHGRKPFHRLETLIVLSPRDVPWLWLASFLQGRRDTLILRAQLNTPPRVDFDLADPTSWTGRMALQQAAGRGWEKHPYEGAQLAIPPGTLDQASAFLICIRSASQSLAPHYWRLSVHREAPHLEVHIPFPDRDTGVEQFLDAFQDLARSVSEPS